ncbi:MAG: thioredoxin-disulfide reductase [Alphaproteobacteria bacterium]|nr:thioredoxin-disulfide reductase [Alphaproteobacteria bacterium]
MAEYRSKVLIIGSGPAGYTAGIYAARAGLAPLLISGSEVGGQLTSSPEIENYPGFNQSSSTLELMDIMQKQAMHFGVKIINDTIVETDFQHRPFECVSANHNIFLAHSVIIATGSSAKWLDISSETKFRGHGISACATCDGFFYRNQDVAVIGGGNSAAEEAVYLTNFAHSVTLIHRRDTLRADKILQDKLRKNPKITIKYNSVVEEFIGEDDPLLLQALKIRNIKNDKTETISAAGAFVAVGHQPNTRLFEGQLQLDAKGYITTAPDSCATSIEGVFAAGDVKDPIFRQAIIAAGSGAQAAIEAGRFLQH